MTASAEKRNIKGLTRDASQTSSTQVDAREWANAPLQTASVDQALAGVENRSELADTQKGFQPERNKRKSRLKITMEHKAHKDQRRSQMLLSKVTTNSGHTSLMQRTLQGASGTTSTKFLNKRQNLLNDNIPFVANQQPKQTNSTKNADFKTKRQFAQMLLHQEYKQHLKDTQRPNTEIGLLKQSGSNLFQNSNLQHIYS